MKYPRDSTTYPPYPPYPLYPLRTPHQPYPLDPRSHPIGPTTAPGDYVYVRDCHGIEYVVPDGSHKHPYVLGNGDPALYAGDLILQDNAMAAELTNLSGTFRFNKKSGWLAVALVLRQQGLSIAAGAIRWFPQEGSLKPIILE